MVKFVCPVCEEGLASSSIERKDLWHFFGLSVFCPVCGAALEIAPPTGQLVDLTSSLPVCFVGTGGTKMSRWKALQTIYLNPVDIGLFCLRDED